jgi:ATP-dependent DNA ligase
VTYPPIGAVWSHEIKHDGFRILAWKQGERVLVWSRRGADFTDRFSRIADAVHGLSADEALIDGEAVVFQDDGRSDFHALLTKRGWEEAAFVAFDLLRLGGDDLRQRPLEKRREGLMRLVAGVNRPPRRCSNRSGRQAKRPSSAETAGLAPRSISSSLRA